jgi:glyoxylase-like metal-dependent hydrolase (beta-lactamase superfamily II)
MTIHHLNCGSLKALGIPGLRAIIYCLLAETNKGLLLVDTGFGTLDYVAPSRRTRLFLPFMGVPRDPEETAVHQVARMGFNTRDVRHIVLTHLHFDHAGGLRDFPNTEVHVYRSELEAAMNPKYLIEVGYDSAHWSHGPKWVLHDQTVDKWFGFDCIPIVEGLEPRVLLIPLPGHTRGHCGVAIETEKGWLLHCGDAASPFHRAADPHDLEASLQRLNFLPDRFARRVAGDHLPRLRKLVLDHGDEVELVSAHDIYSFERHRNAANL